MIRRTTTSMILGVVAWLVLSAASAGAQAPAPPARVPDPTAGPDAAVAVAVAGVDPGVEQGVLARTGTATPAPMMAVAIGLSVLGATLAMITAHRRALLVRAHERATGVAAGRRARTDFWDLPASPGVPSFSARITTLGSRQPARVPRMMASADTEPTYDRRPVRAGSARGFIQG